MYILFKLVLKLWQQIFFSKTQYSRKCLSLSFFLSENDSFHAHDGSTKHWSSGTLENAQDLPSITNNSTTEQNTGSFCIRELSGIKSKSTDAIIEQNSQCTVRAWGSCKNGNICFLELWILGCMNIFPCYQPSSLLVAKKLLS